MNNTILTHIAISDGKIKRSSLEVLSHAQAIAQKMEWTNAAAVLHEQPEAFTDTLKQYGADVIYTVSSPVFRQHMNQPVINAMEQVISQCKPRITAFASTEATKDIIGALGIRTGAAVIPEATHFDVDGQRITASRVMMASKVMADLSSEADSVLVSVRSGSFDAIENPGKGTVKQLSFDFDEHSISAVLKNVHQAAGDTMDLSEADVVVAAGRGVKDEEGKKMIEELADVTGGAIGATRSVVETGMFPASTQIGQTGKVVSPTLYFAIGISGAIQHVSGMANSKFIVAINKDPEAPIFEMATFGLVGDLYKVLPPLIEGIRKAGSNKSDPSH